MNAMSPTHQPDEGYSEDPLNTVKHYDIPATLSALKSPADLPAWMSEHGSSIPMSLKKGKLASLHSCLDAPS